MLLLGCSIIVVAIIIERFIVYHRSRINEETLMNTIKGLLKQNKIKEAVGACNGVRGPVAAILKAGLLKYGAGRKVMEEAFEQASVQAFRGQRWDRLKGGLQASIFIEKLGAEHTDLRISMHYGQQAGSAIRFEHGVGVDQQKKLTGCNLRGSIIGRGKAQISARLEYFHVRI